MITINQILALFFIAAVLWFIVFIWWICDDFDVKEKIMFSILCCLVGLPALIALFLC